MPTGKGVWSLPGPAIVGLGIILLPQSSRRSPSPSPGELGALLGSRGTSKVLEVNPNLWKAPPVPPQPFHTPGNWSFSILWGHLPSRGSCWGPWNVLEATHVPCKKTLGCIWMVGKELDGQTPGSGWKGIAAGALIPEQTHRGGAGKVWEHLGAAGTS